MLPADAPRHKRGRTVIANASTRLPSPITIDAQGRQRRQRRDTAIIAAGLSASLTGQTARQRRVGPRHPGSSSSRQEHRVAGNARTPSPTRNCAPVDAPDRHRGDRWSAGAERAGSGGNTTGALSGTCAIVDGTSPDYLMIIDSTAPGTHHRTGAVGRRACARPWQGTAPRVPRGTTERLRPVPRSPLPRQPIEIDVATTEDDADALSLE